MFQNLKIGSRLAVGFGLLLALCCALSAISLFQMHRLAENIGYYADNLVPSYEKQHEISLAIGAIRRAEFRHVLSNTTEEMAAQESRIAEARAQIDKDLDHYAKQLLSDDRDRQALETLRAALQTYYGLWDQQIVAISRGTVTDPNKTAEANQLMTGASLKAFTAANEALQNWWEYNVGLAATEKKVAQEEYDSAKLVAGLTTAFTVALGLFAAVLITRSITRPLQRATEVARAVAEGDLTSHIEVQGKDETAQLLGALRDMNQGLVQIVGQVRLSSDSIATGSSEIATGNNDLSQRTEEQASNLEETAASMEQLAGTVKMNADTANHANDLAASASQAAARGGDVVQQVVGTMQDISTASRKIADIIGVIDGIAFQTNILALNAAVEAARAGEQGRGFAVVASEVRNLASRAADAAKEIKTLINASVEQVETGTQLVNNAGTSMTEIVSQVQRVSQMIHEISSSSHEQSMGITQVGEAVTQLDQVTQQNAALVEQSAAAAESLRHQAAQLAEVVRKFRLAEDLSPGHTAISSAPVRPAPAAARPTLPTAAARKAFPPAASAPKDTNRAPATADAEDWETF